MSVTESKLQSGVRVVAIRQSPMSDIYHHHQRFQSHGWWSQTGLELPASSTPAHLSMPPPGPPLRCDRAHDTKKAPTRLNVVDEVGLGFQSRHLICRRSNTIQRPFTADKTVLAFLEACPQN